MTHEHSSLANRGSDSAFVADLQVALAGLDNT